MLYADQQIDETTSPTSMWVSLTIAPAIFTLGYFSGILSSFSDAVLLSVSIFIATLISRHEMRIPRLGFTLSAGTVVVFWGILTFGVIGGLLVSVAATLSRYSEFRSRKRYWLKGSFSDVICAGLAGAAHTLVLQSIASVFIFPNELPAPLVILAAGTAMLAAFHAGWNLLGRRIMAEKRLVARQRLSKPNGQHSFAGHLAAGAAAFALFAAFSHFGSAFGLVVVPMAVFGDLAYQIHIRRLAQKTKEIVEASRLHLATVEALATAIDAREQVGVGHVRRTQIYAVGIGVALGLGEDDLNALRTGSLLHDIGKLAVPEHILNKPGRLTQAELEKTKIHATVGASILEKVGFPYPVVPTVRHHHERWDGSGYPDGLRGDQIPITARILAVADAFDALRGVRPFRSSVSREDACNYLRARSGTQFDPNVVGTFLRRLSSLEAEVEILGFGYDRDHQDFADERVQKQVGPHFVEQIKRANQEVFSLYEMAREFGASMDLDETLGLLAEKVREFVPYETCMIYLYDESDARATAAHVVGKNSERLCGKKIAAGEGATGFVLKKCKPVENVNPSLDFAFSHPDLCEDYIGMASFPLLADDKLVGAISIFSGELAVYEEEHLRLLETISRISADAIVKSIKHAESEVYASTDPLTGLPNARSLHVQFDKELARAKRTGSALQLLMLDLDGFKAVNDNLGHKTGDVMLKEIGGIVRSELRDYDFLARYGGDEFVALVPDTDNSDVIELCSRIENAVFEYASRYDQDGIRVGISVGAASFPAQGESFEELLVAADRAMYRTKSFHKQRDARLELGQRFQASPERDIPLQFMAPGIEIGAGGHATIDEGDLVVEVDESRIVNIHTIN
ncbi:MAG TPA: diguanylate cyclase [Pyrinomonadaceae bacterium]|nr:diguanylate cyclase [Pyrinomonadaceae bacterium]